MKQTTRSVLSCHLDPHHGLNQVIFQTWYLSDFAIFQGTAHVQSPPNVFRARRALCCLPCHEEWSPQLKCKTAKLPSGNDYKKKSVRTGKSSCYVQSNRWKNPPMCDCSWLSLITRGYQFDEAANWDPFSGDLWPQRISSSFGFSQFHTIPGI